MADDLANGKSSTRAVAETLHARQQAELIFTRLGPQLLALTPARALPALFSRAELARYRALDRQPQRHPRHARSPHGRTRLAHGNAHVEISQIYHTTTIIAYTKH